MTADIADIAGDDVVDGNRASDPDFSTALVCI
jgi:hypothetical protein